MKYIKPTIEIIKLDSASNICAESLTLYSTGGEGTQYSKRNNYDDSWDEEDDEEW